jgi:molecular chaperone DnaJ
MLSTFLRNPTTTFRAVRCISTSLLKRSNEDSYIPDYYTVLGVSKGSDVKDIKLAYFRMAKKYHPDSNDTDQARFMFQLVAEAYEVCPGHFNFFINKFDCGWYFLKVLTDDEKRKMYDEHGSAFSTVGGKSRGPLRPFGNQSRTAEELFNKIFGESGKMI